MVEMQQILVGKNELNERVRVAEARARATTSSNTARVGAIATIWNERKGGSRNYTATQARDRRVRVEVSASSVRG